MKVLGLDTSSKFLCLGLAEKAIFYEYRIELNRQHLALLAPTIKRALDALCWQPKDLDYLAVGLGPGSFTGLRVGLATIKAFSFAYKKKIVGLSTLEIIANNYFSYNKTVIVALDAKRGLIYCSKFKRTQDGLKKVSPDLLLQKESFIKWAGSGAVIMGDALSLHKEFFRESLRQAEFLDSDYWYPQPRHLLKLALENIKEKNFRSGFDIKPIYLYPKECQIKGMGA